MNDIIRYIIESGISLAVLYAVYLLLLRSQTCFTFTRFYLLISILISLIIPIIHINTPAVTAFKPLLVLNEIRITAESQVMSTPDVPTFQEILFYLYLSVSAVFLLIFLVSLSYLLMLVLTNKAYDQQGFHIVLLKKNLPPFSFFTYLFMDESHRLNGMEEVVEHEKAHIRQWHSADLLLSELIIVFQWFNPFAWFYRRTIKEIHEFIADDNVLKQGYDINTYQLRILDQVFGISVIPLINNFNKSITAKRINMMEKKKSSRISIPRLSGVFLLTAFTIIALACGTKSTDKTMAGKFAQDTAATSLAYLNPDEPAVFPGGIEALVKYIADNVKYPEKALKKGIEGKVYVQVVIDENGKVIPITAEKKAELPPPPPPPPPAPSAAPANASDTVAEQVINVIEAEGIVVIGFKPPEGTDKAYSPEDIALLEQEAVRVIKSLPQFEKPAMQGGKPVRSVITVPIKFALK